MTLVWLLRNHVLCPIIVWNQKSCLVSSKPYVAVHQMSDVQYCLEVERGKPEVYRVVDGLFAGTVHVYTCIEHLARR